MSARIGEGQLIIIRQQQSINSSMSRKDRSRAHLLFRASKQPQGRCGPGQPLLLDSLSQGGVCTKQASCRRLVGCWREKTERVCRLRLSHCLQLPSKPQPVHFTPWDNVARDGFNRTTTQQEVGRMLYENMRVDTLTNSGLISADRRAKPTLMLTIPCSGTKSSARSVTRR